MIEYLRLLSALMKSFDSGPYYLGRKHLNRHTVVGIQHSGVLNPERKLGRAVGRYDLAIKDRSGYSRAVSPRRDEVTHVGRISLRKEAMGCGPIDGGLNQGMSFLYTAVDNTDCRCVGVRRHWRCSRRGLRSLVTWRSRQGNVIWLDDLKYEGIVENKVLEPSTNNLEANGETVRQHCRIEVGSINQTKNLRLVEAREFLDFSFAARFDFIPCVVCGCAPATIPVPSWPSQHQ